MELDEKMIGAAIREARLSKKLTQEELAYKAGLSESAIKQIEGGNRQPLATSLFKIAAVLDMSIDALIFPHPDGAHGELVRQINNRMAECSETHLQMLIAFIDATKGLS